MSPSSRYPFGARIARSCGNRADRHCTSRPWLWTTARRAAPQARTRRGQALGFRAWKARSRTARAPGRAARHTAGRRRRSVTPCCTCTAPSARTPSPTPSPTSSRRRWPTRSSPRSSPCPPAGWSAGSLTASRTGSGRPAGATGCARTSPSLHRARSSPPPWRAPPASRRTTTRGTRPVRCGRCWRSSTRAPGEPWCAPLTAHLGRARSRFAVVAPPGRPLRRLRRAPPRTARRAGGRATTRTCPRTCAWQPEVWRALRARDRRPGSGGAAHRRRRGAAARSRRSPPCRSGCRCSAPPGCPADHLAVLAALAAQPRRAPVAAAPLPRAVGRIAQVAGGVPARRADPTAELPRHPLLGALGRDVRELQLRLAARPGHRHPPSPSGRAAAPRCCSACSATCATTTPRADTSSAPATGRSRCTPATARTARSRCSARSCSACSPTTRRWNRATSSSPARTSRPSPRSSPRRSGSIPTACPTTAAIRVTGWRSGSPTARCAR